MKKTIFVFSALIVSLLLLFQMGQYSIISKDMNVEIVIAVVAVVFFVIGIYINKKSLHKNRLEPVEIDSKKIEELEISKREYEVLQLISEGCSNKFNAAHWH